MIDMKSGATSRVGVLRMCKTAGRASHEEQANKQASPWPLPQFLLPGSFLEFLHWRSVTWECKLKCLLVVVFYHSNSDPMALTIFVLPE